MRVKAGNTLSSDVLVVDFGSGASLTETDGKVAVSGLGGSASDATVTFTDVTTNDASTSKHGFLKKLDNSSAHVLDGTGAWRAPRRTGTTASSATPTINTDNVDYFTITALAAAITSFTTNLSGTPVDGQTLWIAITDNGTARALAWGASFEASGSVPLPTTTVISTRLDVGFVWNTATSKWRCVGTA